MTRIFVLNEMEVKIMKVSKAKYELAMAKANKRAQDIVRAGISASTLTGIGKRDVRPANCNRPNIPFPYAC